MQKQKINKATVKNLQELLEAHKINVVNNIRPRFYFRYSVDDKTYIAEHDLYSSYAIYRIFDNGKRRLYHTYYIQDNLILENLDRGILAINGYKTDIFTFSYPITSYFIVNPFDNVYHIYNKEDVTKKIKQLKNKLVFKKVIHKLRNNIPYRNIPIVANRFSYRTFSKYLYNDDANLYIFSMRLSI